MAFGLDNIEEINASYGYDYGDEVIEAVARAARATVRDGDLIARWDATQFVVLGIGRKPDAQALRRRIDSSIDSTGVQLGKASVRLRVGSSTGSPATTTLEALVTQAQEQALERA